MIDTNTPEKDSAIKNTLPISKDKAKEHIKMLIKYLCDNHHPHTQIIIQCDRYDIVECVEGEKVTSFIRD